MSPDPHNQPGPTVNDRVMVWTALHPVFVFCVYPTLGVTVILALAWWAFK